MGNKNEKYSNPITEKSLWLVRTDWDDVAHMIGMAGTLCMREIGRALNIDSPDRRIQEGIRKILDGYIAEDMGFAQMERRVRINGARLYIGFQKEARARPSPPTPEGSILPVDGTVLRMLEGYIGHISSFPDLVLTRILGIAQNPANPVSVIRQMLYTNPEGFTGLPEQYRAKNGDDNTPLGYRQKALAEISDFYYGIAEEVLTPIIRTQQKN